MNRKVPFAILGIAVAAVLIMLVSVSAGASPIMPPDWSPMHGGTGHDLHGVWGSSDNDVFAVGEKLSHGQWYGVILHYDGSSWSTMSSSTTNFLYGVWGSSHNDVFAVGSSVYTPTGAIVPDSTILHYDGSTWTAMSSGTTNVLNAVWGASDNDVFAVGKFGTLLHYDGSAWSTVTSGIAPDLYAVWGSSGSDVFAVGDLATVLHYDGNTWSRMSNIPVSTSSTYPLYGVWGSSPNDVFAVGSETILHHPGIFTATSAGVNWGLVGRIIAAVVLVGTVFTALWLIDRRGRGKTVEDK